MKRYALELLLAAQVAALSFGTPAFALSQSTTLGFAGTTVVGGWAPGTFEPPEAPKTITIIDRQPNSLRITWHDRNYFEDGYEIFRQRQAGSWEFLAYDQSKEEWPFHVDEGLGADTRYCYRVRAYGANGYSPFSQSRCAYTRDEFENPVWRVELTLHTGSVEDAGTDDPVQVLLNPVGAYGEVPAHNNTWLDYGRDDFERNSNHTYDLNLSSVSELEDITTLIIKKTGNDGWCLRDLLLTVNGQDVYARTYTDLPSGCLWIDGNDGHAPSTSITHDELRNHPNWLNYNPAAALLTLAVVGIPRDEIVSRIEAIVGDTIHDEALYWGHISGDAVTVERGCSAQQERCSSVRVDLDLAADVNNLPDPGVDVDFDLEFACNESGLSVTSTNIDIDADSDFFWEVLSIGLIELLDHHVEDEVEDGWSNIAQTIDLSAGCEVNVDQDTVVRIEESEPEQLHHEPYWSANLPTMFFRYGR